MPRKTIKTVALLLIAALCANLVPVTAYAIDNKWKSMKLTDYGHTCLSESNYADKEAYVHKAFQPILTSPDDDAEYFSALLSFSIQI